MRPRMGIPVIILVLLATAGMAASPVVAGSAKNNQASSGQASSSAQGKSQEAIKPDQEIVALRTANSRTYRSRRGLQAVIYPGPINFQDTHGTWQQIDNTLVPSSLGGFAFHNRANAFDANLPANLANQGVLIKIGGRSLDFALQGATGTGLVSGNVDTFTNALPATTVSYSVDNASVEETLTLQSRAAPASYQYVVTAAADLTPRLVGGNQIDFVTPTGAEVLAFSAPMMHDSSNRPNGISSAITLSLAPGSGGRQVVTLTPDASWLSSSARQWPIVIDPTYSTVGSAIVKGFTGADQDCYIQSNLANGNCTGSTDYVGSTSGYTDRALLQFNIQSAVPSHVTVLAADLKVYVSAFTWGWPVSVDATQITMPWTTQVSWTRRDGQNTWPPGGAIAPSPAWTTSLSTGPGFYSWYLTQLAQGWVDGSIGNYGFVLKASTEGGANQFTIRSTRYASASYWPFLSVTYQLGIGTKPWFKYAGQRLTDRLDVGAQLASGNMLLNEHLLSIAGTGSLLKLTLRYNNLSPALWDFGRSWLLNTGYDVYLAPHSDGVNYYDGTGAGYHFVGSGGTYTSPPGLDASLAKNGDGTYTMTFPDLTKYNFSTNGLTFLSSVDKNGNKVSFSYDANGALTSITDTQGRLTTFGYTTTPTGCTFPSSTGLINLIKDPAARQYQFGYDNNCNLTSYTDPAGGVTKFGYDAAYNLTQVTDPLGNVSQFTYDTGGRVTSATYPSSGSADTTTLTYNAGNTVVKDGNGATTTFYWDNRERIVKRVDAVGGVTTAAYTADNAPSSGQDPTGAQYTANYDAKNNPTKGTSPTAAFTSSVYGDSTHPHLPTSATDPQGNTENLVYDTPGNLAKSTDPLGHATQSAYNPNGTLSSTTDVNGNITTYQYDSAGNLTAVFPVGPDFTYDGISRVLTMTDGKNQKTTYSYDVLDRKTKVAYADGTSASFVYNAADDLTSVTDSTGTTTFTYDPLNRVSAKTLPSGQHITYVWDANGNLTSETDAGGSTSFTYNSLNELTSIKDPSGATTTLGYDAAYRKTSVTYPNGVKVTIGRDSAGEVTSIVAKNGGGTTLLSQTYSYINPANNSQTTQRYSMVDQAGNTTTYTYDGLNRLTGSTTKNSGGTVTDSRSYVYDPLGNRTSQTINGVVTNYTYSTANKTMTVGNLTYTYDNDGNLVSRSDGMSATYNAANLMTSITPPGGSAINMTYTGADQSTRVSAGSTAFVYDERGLSQRTSNGSTVYELRDRTGQLLSERSASGTYYVIPDVAGSTIGLTDSGGNLVSTWNYDPWGNTINSTGTVTTPFLFQGNYYDALTGLYRTPTRFYDPATGRWTQPSRDAYAPSQSRYEFELNNASSVP